MPLHKSGRATRLDPTMISAPLGDFRHTMHIGRGGDAFGDTSFLSNCGPANPEMVKENTEPREPLRSVSSPTATPTEVHTPEMRLSQDDDEIEISYGSPSRLQHSESVSSFDLDLDLGPSILGDVLGVMDGLSLDWTTAGKEGGDGFIGDDMNEVNGIKSKGLRPKVRFSDKKEEIIGRIGGKTEIEFEKEQEICSVEGVQAIRSPVESTNHRPDHSPSPSSSMSSEYEGISPLDRRREDEESEGEGEVVGEQGYTFEDESDDEIGL
ncbi:cdc42 effector protein 5 [Hoplias malabaricus]|uniref:cdc42 effector protein 5 n=1 Tax=Hoplias malabaricus TaxID=27720 RepID=UPI0034638420